MTGDVVDIDMDALLDESIAFSVEDMGGAETIDVAARKYAAARAQVDRIESVLKEAKALLTSNELALHDVLESAGLKSAPHELGRFTRRMQIVTRVEDREAFEAWLSETGRAKEFSEDRPRIKQAAVNAEGKLHWESPEDLPPGVSTLPLRRITFTPKRQTMQDDTGLWPEQED